MNENNFIQFSNVIILYEILEIYFIYIINTACQIHLDSRCTVLLGNRVEHFGAPEQNL